MKLQDWLKRNGWTMRDLGRVLKVSSGYLSEIGLGKRLPSEDLARSIVHFTHGEVTYEEVYNEELASEKKQVHRRGPSFGSDFLISHKVEKIGDENDMSMI